jgi:hypothetical protein
LAGSVVLTLLSKLNPLRKQLLGDGPGRRHCLEPLEPRVLLSAYYVSASAGAAGNPGTLAKPFATIQQAANIAKAGDSVFIRGGTYHETVHPPRSGSASARITFQNYNGETVVIDGADAVGGWANYSGGIYSASMPWTLGDGNDQVFVDGSMMTEARWPNTSGDVEHPTLATAGSVTASVSSTGLSTATIHDSARTQPAGTWVGATIHISPGQNWVYQTGTVTAYSPGVLTYQYQQLTSYEVPVAGNHYYLTGKFQALNAASEWYRDPSSGKLYLWNLSSDNPANHKVEAKHRQLGFDLSGDSYITVQGIQFFACSVITSSSSTHDTLEGIFGAFVSHKMDNAVPWNSKYVPAATGIILNGSNNVIDHSTIAYSSGNGVFLGGSSNTASYCTIHETDYAAADEAGITVLGANDQVLHNTVYNTARSGIVHTFSTGTHIFYNLVHNIGIQTTDAGGIYCWNTDTKGSEVAYNIVYNATGGGFGNTGLFLDDATSDLVVDHNLVYSSDNAMKLNPPANDNNRIYNNTLVGNKYSLAAGANADMTGTIFANNIFTAATIWGKGVIRHNNIARSVGTAGFVSPGTGNYTLAAGSAAINIGAVISPYTSGYTGSAPDAGAYEYGVAPFVAGVPVPGRSAKSVLQAESFNSQFGIKVQSPGIGSCDNGDWIEFSNIDFGSGVSKFIASLAVPAQYAGGQIQVRLDGASGPIIATLKVSSTGSWTTYVAQSTAAAGASGVHNLYLFFKGGFGVCNLDWIQFQ